MNSSNKPDFERRAVVLIAHGSRNADANADAFYFADRLRSGAVAQAVEAAFLELAEPDIATAVNRCLLTHPHVVILIPYFLSAGVHVKRDLAEMCRGFAEAHPEVRFILAEPLGRSDLLTGLLTQRLREALA